MDKVVDRVADILDIVFENFLIGFSTVGGALSAGWMFWEMWF